ncbi:MAG: hypothetical protein DDG59_14590 [Anaerolineae bacterium]|jgi:hypothetical protein|nr:MAG: hypothetical protein DDG59_14590 [Anaerolineae bacterium]
MAALNLVIRVQAGEEKAIVPRIEISQPRPGQALQGSVPILGSTNIRNFAHSELMFAYQNNPTDTWFILAESDQGVVNQVLAVWDTTSITDNFYQLSLIVTTKDNQRHIYRVEGLRVRNYTPVETETPQPSQPGEEESVVTQQPTSLPVTPTPLPTNPLILRESDLTQSALKGMGMVVVFFLIGIVLMMLRQPPSSDRS